MNNNHNHFQNVNDNFNTIKPPEELTPIEFLKESEIVARKAAIRWGVNQSGGIPMPFVPKDNFFQRFLRLFN
jgi:hypothetical protein